MKKLICRKMWDISILYEFSLICNFFGCPQNGDTCGVLFRDLFHASQIYLAFMAFLFLLLILSQAYNEIILFKTWFLYDHCNWFASPDWSSLTFLSVPACFRTTRLIAVSSHSWRAFLCHSSQIWRASCLL